jgi:subtilisin family serine protease
MPDTKHYLRDAKTGKKVQLETSEKRLTLLVKEKDPVAVKKALSKIEKMVLKASLIEISSGIYEVEFANNPSDEEINKIILRIRKELTNVIPYNVYKAKDRYGLIYITDEIIVTFSAGTSAGSIELLTKKYNLNKIEEYVDDKLICVFAQKPGNWDNPIEVANKIENEKGVEIAEPNLVHRLINTATTVARPTDTFFGKQWQLEKDNQPNISPDAHVHAIEAWNILEGGGDPNVVIAVVDFGFDLTHPDLINKLVNIDLDPFDFVDRAGGPKFPKPQIKIKDHGTCCAGIAVAENNGVGVVGIAFGCSLLPVCSPDSPKTSELCRIFRAIRDKADVISCSFAPQFGTTALSPILERLMEKIAKSEGRRNKGCVICFAAGNGNLPLDEVVTNPEFFVNGVADQVFETVRVINPYASHKDVIAVAASTAKNKKALYSNWGKEVWVCAPSDDITPRGTSIRPGVTTTSSMGNLGHSLYTNKFGGTSSAAPLVAGIAALVISANPSLTAKEVKEIIKETADKIDPENNEAGKYDATGHSIWYGYGKVNAGRAVEVAIGMRS